MSRTYDALKKAEAVRESYRVKDVHPPQPITSANNRAGDLVKKIELELTILTDGEKTLIQKTIASRNARSYILELHEMGHIGNAVKKAAEYNAKRMKDDSELVIYSC